MKVCWLIRETAGQNVGSVGYRKLPETLLLPQRSPAAPPAGSQQTRITGFAGSLADGQPISTTISPESPCSAVSPADVDLVVVSDSLVADPRMVRDLHNRGVPHFAVRVRDGTGLVGPLVIPGVTSCLGSH